MTSPFGAGIGLEANQDATSGGNVAGEHALGGGTGHAGHGAGGGAGGFGGMQATSARRRRNFILHLYHR